MIEVTPLMKLLILPLKFLTVVVFATVARIFYEKDELKEKAPKITFALVFTRMFMSLFVLVISFYALKLWLSLSETSALMFSGGAAFAYREIMDSFLGIAKRPFKIKEFLSRGSTTDGDTVDPSGEEFPEDDEK